jgi:hypothetical protein
MPDGTSVISAGGDQIRIWNIADSKLTGEIAGSDAESASSPLLMRRSLLALQMAPFGISSWAIAP